MHPEDPLLAVKLRVNPADQLLAVQRRQDVIAVLPLIPGHIHLQLVLKIEEGRRPVAVVNEPVERREQRRASGSGSSIVASASGAATQLPATPSMETGTAIPLPTISGQVSLWYA